MKMAVNVDASSFQSITAGCHEVRGAARMARA
jgi:hypothetical protein